MSPISRLTKAFLLCFLAALPAMAPAAAAEPATPLVITVDDLPLAGGRLHRDSEQRRQMTVNLLAALARHQIQAVGLVIWNQVRSEADRDLLRLWVEAGHELGNHSASHLNYTVTDSKAYIEDVEAGRQGLADFLLEYGRQVRFFRFPMLREGETATKLEAMRRYLVASGQTNLHVTIDNQDWSFERPWVEARRQNDLEAMARIGHKYHEALHLAVGHHQRTGDRMLQRTTPQILLLHANEVGASHWDELFTWLQGQGYRFASVDEVMGDPAFAEPPAYVGTHGPGYWDRMLAVRRAQDAETEVRQALTAQAAAWNRGDLETFCAIYAEDAASGLTLLTLHPGADGWRIVQDASM